MRREYTTTAITLKRARFAEADNLVTLYTKDKGKVKARVAGAQRLKSKLHLEPLTLSRVQVYPGRTFNTIIQKEILDSFTPLKENLWRISCGLYLTELVDKSTLEGVENTPLFQLLSSSLSFLCVFPNEVILRYFELHLLSYLGFHPELHRCVICSSSLKPQMNFFSPHQGGMVCPSCSTEQAYPLSMEGLKVLRFLERVNLDTALRLKLSPELSSEVESTLERYVGFVLQRRLNLPQWLSRLKGEGIYSP